MNSRLQSKWKKYSCNRSSWKVFRIQYCQGRQHGIQVTQKDDKISITVFASFCPWNECRFLNLNVVACPPQCKFSCLYIRATNTVINKSVVSNEWERSHGLRWTSF